jgi:hypothetical protein
MTRTAKELQQLVADFQDDKAGKWEYEGYVIERADLYNMLVVKPGEPKRKLPNELAGKWTDLETLKHAINSINEREKRDSTATD